MVAAAQRAYCRCWEFTWPSVLGFSTNENTVDAGRRVGRAFAECDLELDESFFKLDGHGREGQRGMRLCRGDSGGPVLWPTGFGGFAVGGVNSATDDFDATTDRRCPSERGESFQAAIPAAFLDRVAQTDAVCAGSAGWERCPGLPAPYGGFELHYQGTEIEPMRPGQSLHLLGSRPGLGRARRGGGRRGGGLPLPVVLWRLPGIYHRQRRRRLCDRQARTNRSANHLGHLHDYRSSRPAASTTAGPTHIQPGNS